MNCHHKLPRPSMGVKRFGLTALGMYSIHPLEDLVQYHLGLNSYWYWAIVCGITFPLICAALAEFTHGKKMHDKCEDTSLDQFFAAIKECTTPEAEAEAISLDEVKKRYNITPPHVCPKCNGSGRLSNGKYPKYDICPKCGGIGRVDE